MLHYRSVYNPTMRILCMSDIHSNFEAFDPDAMPDADMCAIAGDITEYGHSRAKKYGGAFRRGIEWLAAMGARQPTFVIPGNHDIGVRNGDFAGIPGVVGLLNRRADCLGFSLYGVSLSPTYNMPRMARIFDLMTIDHDEEDRTYDFEPVDIVISHAPPLGVLDQICDKDAKHPGPNIGSEALLRYIERHGPKLVVCGHVHNEAGRQMVGSTLVVNASKTWCVLEL